MSVFLFQVDADDASRVLNTHVVIDNTGNIKATYDKTHLFDLDIKGQVRLCESDYTIPGSHIIEPVETPAGKVGLCTVYFHKLFEDFRDYSKAGLYIQIEMKQVVYIYK